MFVAASCEPWEQDFFKVDAPSLGLLDLFRAVPVDELHAGARCFRPASPHGRYVTLSFNSFWTVRRALC